MRQLLINGKIYLEAERFADSMLIENGVIQAVGTREEVLLAADVGCASGESACIEASASGVEVVDLEGHTIVPGFNDSHLHLSHIGAGFFQVDLNGISSIEEGIARGRAFLGQHPETTCLVGSGWNQDYFTTGEARAFQRVDLDRITTDIPVVFTRVCGHIVSINSKAIELLGLSGETAVEGGTIVLDENGQPTGEVQENAIYTAYTLLPEKSEEQCENEFLIAAMHAIQNGITSVQSADANGADYERTMRRIERIYREKRTPLRYSHQFSLMQLEMFEDYLEKKDTFSFDERMLSRGALKLFKDGSLGGRTALLRSAYADDEGNKGVSTISQDKLNALVSRAQQEGIRAVIHAIGDGAVESVVDAIEYATKGNGNPLGHGIVHCQITDLPLLQRIAKLDIRLMVQPIFLDYDIDIVEDRVGRDLASTSYAFRTMIALNEKNVSFGTDSPVEDLIPMDNIAAAVTRTKRDGSPNSGFFPEECISVSQAIDAYTIHSAYNEGKAEWKGRLLPGYVADLVVLSADIFSIHSRDLRSVTVERTMIDGVWVYEAEAVHRDQKQGEMQDEPQEKIQDGRVEQRVAAN